MLRGEVPLFLNGRATAKAVLGLFDRVGAPKVPGTEAGYNLPRRRWNSAIASARLTTPSLRKIFET